MDETKDDKALRKAVSFRLSGERLPRINVQFRIDPELLDWVKLYSITRSFDSEFRPVRKVTASDIVNEALSSARSQALALGVTTASLKATVRELEIKYSTIIQI